MCAQPAKFQFLSSLGFPIGLRVELVINPLGNIPSNPFSGLVLNLGEKLRLTFPYVSFKNDQLSLMTTERGRPTGQQALAKG